MRAAGPRSALGTPGTEESRVLSALAVEAPESQEPGRGRACGWQRRGNPSASCLNYSQSHRVPRGPDFLPLASGPWPAPQPPPPPATCPSFPYASHSPVMLAPLSPHQTPARASQASSLSLDFLTHKMGVRIPAVASHCGSGSCEAGAGRRADLQDVVCSREKAVYGVIQRNDTL